MTHIVERFKTLYASHTTMDLNKLDELYNEQIVFRDPIHTLKGLPAVRDYLANMYENVTECRFEYLDQLVGNECAYIKWNMHVRHPKLGNKLITVKGCTHIQFDNDITFHEDIYDLGEMLYENVPLLGAVIKKIKKRLA